MNKEMKDTEKTVAKFNLKACGTITCIHNIDSKCILKKCELYERSFRQEY